MRKYYTVDFDDEQAVKTVGGRDDSARYKKGQEGFQPMYLIKQIPADARKLVSSESATESSAKAHVLGNVLRLHKLPVSIRRQKAAGGSRFPDYFPQQQT